MVQDYYNKRDTYKTVKTGNNGTLIVKQLIEGNSATMMVEMDIEGLVPNDFINFIDNWAAFTKRFNPYVRSIDLMSGTGDKYQTYKTVSKAPWPMSDRYMFNACYRFINFGQDEHLLITSEKGLDAAFEQNLTAAERKNLVRCSMSIGCWWFKPIRDMHGVTATKLFSVVNADAGGKVPKWIQTIAAPQVAVQSSNDFTGFIRKMRASALNE